MRTVCGAAIGYVARPLHSAARGEFFTSAGGTIAAIRATAKRLGPRRIDAGAQRRCNDQYCAYCTFHLILLLVNLVNLGGWAEAGAAKPGTLPKVRNDPPHRGKSTGLRFIGSRLLLFAGLTGRRRAPDIGAVAGAGEVTAIARRYRPCLSSGDRSAGRVQGAVIGSIKTSACCNP